MSADKAQANTNRQSGHFNLSGGLKGLFFYMLLAAALYFGLFAFHANYALSLLLFPLVISLAVLGGLLLHMVGAIICSAIIFLISTCGYFLDLGLFNALPGSQPLIFLVGFNSLGASLSLAASLLVGYHRRSAELAVQEQNLLYKVFNSLPIGIWVRARNGRSLFVNERWASFSSLSVEEILASESQQPPVDLGEEWNQEVIKLLDSDDSAVRYQSIELTDNRKVRSSMTLLTLRMLIDHENDFGTLSLLVDETALRLYEKKIQQSEQNLHLALNNARMGFWDEYVQSKEARCDENWFQLIDAERLPDQSPVQIWESRLHPDDRARVLDQYREFYHHGEGSMRLDYRIRKGKENYIWVQDSVRITEYDVDGTPQRVMGTMQDISDQKKAEIELIQAKVRAETANMAKSQFIATISHEIRTPLNAIIGLSSFLTENELEDEQLDLAQMIHSSGKSLLFLVNDILDFSKIEADRLELEVQEFPLLLCFEDSVKLFRLRASEKNVELVLNLSKELAEFAVGDMERLRQIIQNLLANALKFTEWGEVKLSVRPVSLGDLDEAHRPNPLERVGYLDQPDHDYLEVCIEDTGIGIPADRQHLLFEAFSQVDASTTRKYGGTGLGLVICKRLVHAMGGRIWVESKEGQGSCFCFVVRIKLIHEHSKLKALTKKTTEAVERIAEEHPCDILIVGPEDDIRPLIVSCRKLGYAPHSTEDYDLDSSVFRRRLYNVMFIWMGDEVKADELARKISVAGQILKPETILGCAPPEQKISKDRCRLSGMHAVIQGEFRPSQIRKVILSALGVPD